MRDKDTIILESIYSNLRENQNDFYFDQPKYSFDFSLRQKVLHVDKAKMFWAYKKEKGDPPIGFSVPIWKPTDPSFIKLEDYMEKIRKRVNSDAVSRLNCKFVCPIKSGWCSCDSYYDNTCIVEVTGKIYVGDIDLYSRISDIWRGYYKGLDEEELLKSIESYWDIERYSYNPEILVDGEVVVVDYACGQKEELK